MFHRSTKFWVIALIQNWPRPFLGVVAITRNRYLGFWRSYRLGFGLKRSGICKFILALITTLSSKPFSFLVIFKKLNTCLDAKSRYDENLDFRPNLAIKSLVTPILLNVESSVMYLGIYDVPKKYLGCMLDLPEVFRWHKNDTQELIFEIFLPK